VAGFMSPLIVSCSRSPSFDIGWDEEVQLNDGRVLIASVKYTYQRLGGTMSLSRYEPSILRDTKFSFDPGGPLGRFTQTFRRHRVDLIARYNNAWYLVLETRGAPLFIQTAGGWKEEWGPKQDSSGHKCWKLDGPDFIHASFDDLRNLQLSINMLMDYAPVAELASLNGTLVTLSQKESLVGKYPLNPSDLRIGRSAGTANKKP
jgi:hypothetical protein